MYEKNKIFIGCLVFFAIAGLGVIPAFGSLQETGTPYAGTWRGSTDFNSENLSGTVYWAVFGPGDFPFSGYTPTPGELTYVYQIDCTGSDIIKNYSVPLENIADNIGSFSDGVIGTTIIPTSSMSIVAPSGSAVWTFDGIGTDESSVGLVFSSTNTPMLSTSLIKDGGHIATAEVPVPSAIAIPEPASVLVWLLGLGLCLTPITLPRLWKR